ncbi:MAG: hypothetical protein U0270_37500 [Labilithrix sp.]
MNPTEFIDQKGRHWVYMKTVPSRSEGTEPAPEDPVDDPERSVSTFVPPTDPVELAEGLRPVLIRPDGSLWQARDLDIDAARRILANGIPPETLGDRGSRGPEEQAQIDTGVSIRSDGIIGSDDRVIVDGSVYPYRAVGRFQNQQCSGWFVGSRTIATAAHCVWDKTNGQPYNYGAFVPGLQPFAGADYAPWGYWSMPNGPVIPSGYINSDKYYYDFAFADVVIPAGWVGSPGWFGTAGNRCLTASLALGYPGQAPWGNPIGNQQAGSLYGGCQYLCYTFAGDCGNPVPWMLTHTLDWTKGMSGGPLYHVDGSSPIGYAINTRRANGDNWNGSRRWDSTTYNFFANSVYLW